MLRVRRAIPEPRLELTPLLDVVFLLLTFFIFALVLTVRLDVTDIRLPEVRAGTPPERSATITVALDASGRVLIDGTPTPLESVPELLKQARESAPDAQVFIAADERAPSGDLFRLVDTLREAGVTDLRFLRLPAEAPKTP